MTRQLRAALWLAYAVYLGWVVYLVWTPSPGLPGTTITRVVNLGSNARRHRSTPPRSSSPSTS